MSFILKVWDTDDYIELYDPHFIPPSPAPPYPSGLVAMTTEMEKAQRFASMQEVVETMATVCEGFPVRPDGMPNRPLTGLTLEIVHVDE